MLDSEETSPPCEPDRATTPAEADFIPMPDLRAIPLAGPADDTVLANALRLALARLADGDDNYAAHGSSSS